MIIILDDILTTGKKKFAILWQTLNKHEDIKREYKKKLIIESLDLIIFLIPYPLHIYKVALS